MKKNLGVLSLVLILAASAIFATPVFAKNLNVPSDERVIYYSGGSATVNIPSPLPNYPPSTWPQTPTATATMMKLAFVHIQIPNAGTDASGVLIELYSTSSANHQYIGNHLPT